MIEIRVKRKFFDQVPALTCKYWGGDLYPDIRSSKRTKFSLVNLATRKNKTQASTEQSPSIGYITNEKKSIHRSNTIRTRKPSVRRESLEIEKPRQKTKDYPASQLTAPIRLADQGTTTVTTTTSTTMTPSLTVASTMTVTSTIQAHHELYETTILPDTGKTLWADINVPADNTCLFYAVTLGTLLPVLQERDEFARCFRALFGEDKDEEAISQLQNCLKNFDGSANFIQDHSAQLEVLVNVDLRQRIVDVMRQNPLLYKGNLALEIATTEVSLLAEDDYQHYLQKMENPKGSWGGLIEVGVMSQLLNIPILTYEQVGLHFVPKDASSNSQGKVIRIALTKASSLATHNNHFHVLLKPEHILVKTSDTISHLGNKPPSQNTFFPRYNPNRAISIPPSSNLAQSEEVLQLNKNNG
jgi:hypothetical protein